MRAIVCVLALMAGCGPSQADGDRACASAPGCETSGHCWYDSSRGGGHGPEVAGVYVHLQCVARSSRDCERAYVCRELGFCRFEVSSCVK